MGCLGDRKPDGIGESFVKRYLLTEQVSHPQNGAWSLGGRGVEVWEREGVCAILVAEYGRGVGVGSGMWETEAEAIAAVLAVVTDDEEEE